jgi:hypothetical protein
MKFEPSLEGFKCAKEFCIVLIEFEEIYPTSTKDRRSGLSVAPCEQLRMNVLL